MPVTINPASHEPKQHPQIRAAESLKDFLWRSCPESCASENLSIQASSFTESPNLYPSSSSFIRSAIEAWGRHAHLVLRPEDLWFTILVQLNFYMEQHAEELRDKFVSHQGQVLISINKVISSSLVDLFRNEIQQRIHLPWLGEWISPGFSTSTEVDETTATVLMMGVAKAYFEYEGGEVCGMPSVTLLGTREDWYRLLGKIDRLSEFGAEPTDYANRLRPILSRVAGSFDTPNSRETRDFWDQMVQAKVMHSRLCGVPPLSYTVSGWVLGFCYWDGSGRRCPRFVDGVDRLRKPGTLQYDGIRYGEVPLHDVPVGYAKVPFGILDAGAEVTPAWILAGNIGKSIVDGAPQGYEAAVNATLQRTSGAAMKDPKEAGCLTSLLRSLSCFGNDKQGTSEEVPPLREMVHRMPETHLHSAIQPTSGWFLFTPQEDASPFVDNEDYGPTVDAIESCDGVEHFDENR